jgi:hypothetical protein
MTDVGTIREIVHSCVTWGNLGDLHEALPSMRDDPQNWWGYVERKRGETVVALLRTYELERVWRPIWHEIRPRIHGDNGWGFWRLRYWSRLPPVVNCERDTPDYLTPTALIAFVRVKRLIGAVYSPMEDRMVPRYQASWFHPVMAGWEPLDTPIPQSNVEGWGALDV